MATTGLFPIALDLRGKRCVVVGGGAVGERRARALIEAGAEVVVVAPELLHESGAAHVAAPFHPDHLDGAFLVIAATDRPEVNAAVAAAARARGLPVSLAAPGGDEDSGDFVTMAAVRRGDLLIAVTTGGAGPALAARLRRDLEAQFGPEWEPYIDLLREMRDMAKRQFAGEQRTTALRRLAASDAVRARLAAGDAEGARREALACLW